MPRMDAADALRWLGGTARWADLARHTTQHSVRRALDRRLVDRPAFGTYVLTGLPEARTAAARAHGVLSHLSAADHWGIEFLGAQVEVHVTVAPGSSPARQPRVVVHRSLLRDEDLVGPVTSPLRTVLDCATRLPFREALAVADSALHRRLVTGDELVAAAGASRGPGRPARCRVARAADPRAENPFESALRAEVIGARISGFQPQLTIALPDEEYRVDLGDPGRRMVLEADSFEFHGERQALARDCRRYDDLVSAGWLVLRYAWEQVMFDRPWVTRTLLATCAQRSRSPGRRSGVARALLVSR